MIFKNDAEQSWWNAQVHEITQDPDSSSAYAMAILNYAQRWAELMELRMSDGESLEEIAYGTSAEADNEGVTANMYGLAVSVLVRCWEYGERLRIWHNLKTQYQDEGERANESGGVLNPAVMILQQRDPE